MKSLQCAGRARLNQILVILNKESRHNTHYDAALMEAIDAYFRSKAVKQSMAKTLKAQPLKARTAMTKSLVRGHNVRAS